ncbi:MAG: hypothetical protein IKP07_04280 [Bacilli bacterium]|nr:hypothetical protein [Bacilli bacterium]
MKKETIAGLKREIKELEERNNRLYKENRQYERDLEDYKDTKKGLEEIKIAYAEVQGKISGINIILDKITFDTSIAFKRMSEKELYEKMENKRISHNSYRW